jgi:hypothetical protein
LDALLNKCDELKSDRDALRARIDELEAMQPSEEGDHD